jgi:stage II sporulation protein M
MKKLREEQKTIQEKMKKNNFKSFNKLSLSKSYFIRELNNSIKFIRESKKFIYVISLIFFASFLIGLLIRFPLSIQEQLINLIKKIVEQTKGVSTIELIFFIIFNNLKSTFLGILFGVLFGILPILIAVLNGILLGFVSYLSINKEGLFSLWKIFPHGIFEIPAIFISLGLGLRLGISLLKKDKDIKKIFINSFKTYFFIILFLIIIAGIIEGILISVLK